jgi:hypothetical protein
MIYGARRTEAYPDIIDALMALGLNREMATMSIPYVWFRPATTDPYSPVTIAIVQGVQKTLALMGIKTRGDGYVDGYTRVALDSIAGPDWKSRSWIHVIDDVLYAGATGKMPAEEENSAMGYLGNDEGYASVSGLPKTTWCSERNPQGKCKPIRGVCKPMDRPTLELFWDLQRNTNAHLAKAGKTLLDVDGRIGPKTVKGVNFALGSKVSHCDDISANADNVNGLLSLKAAAVGAKRVPDPKRPGGSPPSLPGPGGSVIHPPLQQAGFTQFVTSPIGMASIAGAVLFFLVMQDKKKPSKKRKKPTRRRRLPKKRITQSYY